MKKKKNKLRRFKRMTPAARRRIKNLTAKLDRLAQPTLDQIARQERLTADDFAVTFKPFS